MTEKPPLWADWLLSLWVVAVGAFYFGGYFLPGSIGRYTAAGAALYALMLLTAVGTLAFRYLHRPPAVHQPKDDTKDKTISTKIRK